jgi:hypothetical protein
MKNAVLAMLFLLAAQAGAAAGPDIVLYGPEMPEMYKYAFPPESSVDSQEQGKNRQLVYKLKGDVWAGGGIGVKRARVKSYLDSGALEFYVRGAKGGEKIDVGFVMAKGLDEKDLAYQILIPVGNYARITNGWTKVTIPLKDFPAEGSRWLETEQRRAVGAFNWDRVSEFVVSREPGMAGFETVAFANVRILGAYDPKAVTKPQAQKATGAVLFYSEAFASDGGGAYAYPAGSAKVEEVSGGKQGKMALQATLVSSAWSGGGVYRAPLDLSHYRDKGVLEVWAKGGKGGEEVYLGLVDKANGASVRLSSNSYLPGGLKTDWQLIRIPLKDFPAKGAKWDEASQRNLSFDFDWTKVSEVLFDNNGPNNANDSLFFDEIAIKPAP